MPKQKKVNIRPHIDRKFDKHEAERIIKKIMAEELDKRVYESSQGSEITRLINRRVHDAIRQLPCDRYKFCIHVVIGEKLFQGVKSQCGCLWDDDTDCIASVSLNKESMYCITTVYAIYCYYYE